MPKTNGLTTPVVARVVLSIVTWTMITELAVREAGSMGPPKRARITDVVEKPSSALIAVWLGIKAFAGSMLSVPSVEPAKYRSVG